MRKASVFHQEMSTRDQFQEFQLPEKRKKVDVQLMDSAVTSSHSEKNSLKSGSVCDLRKSLAWDSAFFTSPGVLDPEELFGTLNIQFVDDGEVIAQGRGRKSLKLESAESERTTATGVSSVRKSLAWDRAFFTSEGVLNAEELSIVNRGFRKSEMHVVPETDEKIWRSDESNSGIRHDECSLASLEVDLFDAMRSSMPNFVEASRRRTAASHKLAGEKMLHNGHKATKSATFLQIRDSSGVSSSLPSLKPPKVSGPANPLPRAPKKRASLSANKFSMETKATRRASSQKNMTLPKKTCLRDSFSTVSSSTPSTKSPSSVLHTAKRELAGFSGCKSPNPLRRTDSQLVSSVLSYRIPSKFSARNRSDSASLLSTPKSCSCASSVNSIDGLSSESSASSVGWRLNYSAASKSTPSRVVPFEFDDTQDLDSGSHHNNVPFVGLQNGEEGFRSPLINKVSAGIGAFPVSPLTNLKTSGLRMPSPKIGFFDTESPTGLPLSEHPNIQSGTLYTSKIGTGGKCVNAAASRTRNGNHLSMEKSAGAINDTGTKDKLRVSSREKKQQGNVSGQVSHKNFHRSKEDNKENAGNLENQVDGLIKRMEAVGFTKCERNRSPSSLFVKNTCKHYERTC